MAQCRICYDEGTIRNPLVSVCECKGSVEFSHTQCLMKWIKTTENEDFQKVCEMCMTPYNFIYTAAILTPGPRWLWRFFQNATMVNCWTFLIHSLVYIAAMAHPRPSNLFQLCRNVNFIFTVEMFFITAIYISFYAPIVYRIKPKVQYLFHWLNPFPYRRELRNKRPFLMLIATLLSFFASFSFIYAGGIVYLVMLPELYNTHVAILKTMRSPEFLENEVE